MKPCVLDLYCCAGGMTKGLQRAGAYVVGVDRDAQPNYCGDEFFRMDALVALRILLRGERLGPWALADFTAVHASPPCQARSDLQKQSKLHYDELVPPTRELLLATGLPYSLENVEGDTDEPGAELIDPVTLCGTMFPELRVIRHRLFETNWPLPQPPHPSGRHPLVFTYDKRKAHYGKLDQDTSFVQVTGGGNCTVANAKAAMGIDWDVTKDELNEAIPPAYGEYVGSELLGWIYTSTESAA